MGLAEGSLATVPRDDFSFHLILLSSFQRIKYLTKALKWLSGIWEKQGIKYLPKESTFAKRILKAQVCQEPGEMQRSLHGWCI